MAQPPVIYTIQASDAPQHTVKLREILLDLKSESRIEDYKLLDIEEGLSKLTDQVKEEDLILIVLTNQLETHKEQIENRFRALKSRLPGARVAEILVDNIVYDNEFITFPADLRPIRNCEDMDGAWSSIEESLKDMFPARSKQKQGEQLVNERLNGVEKHPDYPELLKAQPGSAYLYGGYIFQLIFGLIFTSIAVFFIFEPPPDDGSLFYLVWIVGSFIFIVVGVGIVGFGIYKLIKLSLTSLRRRPSLVLDKRMAVRGGGQSSSASTTYYITLEFNDRERREIKTRGKLYGKITKDDVGVAYILDDYLLDFRRLEVKK